MKHIFTILIFFVASNCFGQIKSYMLPKCTEDGTEISVEYSVTNDAVVCCYDAETGEKLEPCPEFSDCIWDQPIDLKCSEKRTIKVGYDNGVTPGSSSNDCGSRVNFVSFAWEFEVVSWEVNGTLYGAGETLGPFTTWTPQLQGWADFFNEFDPTICTDAAFGFKPAPTWRFAEITSCDARVVYGPLILERKDDGCIFTVYPVIDSYEIDRYYHYTLLDCKEDEKETVFCDKDGKEIETPDCHESSMPCGFDFKEFISGESPCIASIYDTVCDKLEDGTLIPYVIVINDCGNTRNREVYTLDSWLNGESPDDLIAYEPIGSPVDCLTGDDFEEPDPETEPLGAEGTKWCVDGTPVIVWYNDNKTVCVTDFNNNVIDNPVLEDCCCSEDDDVDPCALIKCADGQTCVDGECVDDCDTCEVSLSNVDASNTSVEKGSYVGGGAVDLFLDGSNVNSVNNQLSEMDATCVHTCWYMQVSDTPDFTGTVLTDWVCWRNNQATLVGNALQIRTRTIGLSECEDEIKASLSGAGLPTGSDISIFTQIVNNQVGNGFYIRFTPGPGNTAPGRCISLKQCP